ncbi:MULTISPECIES: helicase-related protein [unclassified Lactobacillus]|uniref:helicase-related protein n=1 Tax=unclassified Lactobacillus TaxID=2620435 RepID=UPI00226AB49C|nr:MULTISPECIES: helicase-related protein [unclassified Lactobacillus]MCX8722275.1 DEAD/DEAH box helicase family protein [Lactobacillus sp. B4010]MCX8732299.1 DEAD/DEAH box helicase family protein [Lactobacillus sp. B4015]MCX8734506.1 DEAD/DEAH box helicase family protein [Lactobacillus sp. B4012]
MENLSNLAGRQWISSHKDFSIIAGLTKTSAISAGHCNRCGAKIYAHLPNKKRYCRECIGIGRIVEGDFLIHYQNEVSFPTRKNGGLTWTGRLTGAQAKIAHNLVTNFRSKQDTLVHAVTGAGKTEMLFPVIAECIAQGKRCCIATPRIDVVNELFPRFQAAFSEIEIGKYHGREFKQPGLEQLTICTTHQLLKFYHAFALLVIDEADSFPYVENRQLHFAAKNAVKNNGVRVYLTATPTADLLSEAKAGKIDILRLNRRFHGGLLPVPREQLFLKPFLAHGKIHPKLLKAIITALKKGHPLLLFVPRIDQIPDYIAALKKVKIINQVKMAGVWAQDKNRLRKVQMFRDGELQLLVTTTILERGVTFKHVWVIIVQADDQIFTAASLVQIAGRVGRAHDDTTGLVLFCYRKYTKNIREAKNQIEAMNK